MIVVDASLAAKWIFRDEEYAAQAQALQDSVLTRAEVLIAPPMLNFEVTNIIRQRMRRNEFGLDRALSLVDQFLTFPILLAAPIGLHRRALALAHEFGLQAAYDAHYLALAEWTDAEVWTDDRRLLRQVGGRFPALRWIGDYR